MDATIEKFPCLGLKILGMCSYNPTHPASVYFDLGSAVTALGFIMAVQQFLKPIYIFRLRAYGIKTWHLYLSVFLGFLCAVIASILPNLPISHTSFLEYPVVWELVGALIIGVTYFIVAMISLHPAQIKNFNLILFVRAAGYLLSTADDNDRVSFIQDLSYNFAKLIKYSCAWEIAERQASGLEKEDNVPLPHTIHGRSEISAFYMFAHRKELERASYASSLLRLIADPHFCSALVCKSPWQTALMIRDIGEKRLHGEQAVDFIQEIVCQALVNDESIITREIEYTGFGSVPLLSDSLFKNWNILTCYNPLGGLEFKNKENISERYISKLNSACESILKTALNSKDYWPQRYMNSVEQAYKVLFNNVSYKRYKKLPNSFSVELAIGIFRLYRLLIENLNSISKEERKQLFIKDPEKNANNIVHIMAAIIYEGLCSIANSFEGSDDDGWVFAIGIFHDIFPFHDTAPVGMNPLQQQLAVQLIKKLQNNMDGWYPAISRILLSVIGPYKQHIPAKNRSAYIILKDAVYKELQKIPDLYTKNPDKISDYLPSNIIYDSVNKRLTHTSKRGKDADTDLSALVISEVNFFDEQNWDAGQT